jgi:hypothetical protein
MTGTEFAPSIIAFLFVIRPEISHEDARDFTAFPHRVSLGGNEVAGFS